MKAARVPPHLNAMQNPSVLRRYRQHTNFDCGVWAAAYALALVGIRPNIETLTGIVAASPRWGSSPGRLVAAIKNLGAAPRERRPLSVADLRPPALVDFWYEGMGHWGVLLATGPKKVRLFDPWAAEVIETSRDRFERNWFSRLYGRHVAIEVGRAALVQ